MLGKGKKRNRTSKRTVAKTFGDVTINDYANAAVCGTRARKANTSTDQVVKQQVNETEALRALELKASNSNHEIAVAWDSGDEDDFDFVQEENEDGTTKVVIKRSVKQEATIFYQSNQYPIDIWFLISEFITPEDVGRFAGICKSTYSVVSSAKFWFSLYRRYYNRTVKLPERLQPELMVRMYGLRTSVIRALYHMYPPFQKRPKTKSPRELMKQQCVLMWRYKKHSKYWVFCFKFKADSGVSRRQVGPKPDLIAMLEDIYANNDDNCCILQIKCPNYVLTPPVIGLKLVEVSLKLSQNLTNHRLSLTFTSGVVYSQSLDSHSAATTIIFDPVFNVTVLNWWNTEFTHSPYTLPLHNEEENT